MRNKQHQIRFGLTLIEVMIALTMTLIVLGAMMVAFKFASQEMAKGRATIEMSNQTRAAEELLRSDLEKLTLDPRPWMQTAAPSGYFEYVEGPGRDFDNAAGLDSYLGDIDDVLCMTVQSTGVPFRGRYNGSIIESSLAEVVWFTIHNDRDGDGLVDFDESVDVCRRVMLVRPDLATDASWAATSAAPEFPSTNDVSYRNEGGTILPNSLSDLAKRENRFCHNAATFPHALITSGVGSLAANRTGGLNSASVLEFNGEDIQLTDVAAFDMKVYSPDTDVADIGVISVEAGDTNYAAAAFSGTVSADGGFVDLGDGTGKFSGSADPKSGFGPAGLNRTVFCTWSPHYEFDGFDQDGDATIDEGTDGIDNDGVNGVDDVVERETIPPYQQAIRGFKVTFRLKEKNSKQIRQSSLIHSFVPE